MFRNYLTIAYRNLRKHSGYSIINIFGLGIGLAVSVLILLFIRDELSYDRYHEHAESIYRVYMDGEVNGNVFKSSVTCPPMAEAFKTDLPEVVQSTRIMKAGRSLISHENRAHYEEGFLWADSTVFDVFTFPLIQGDPRKVLAEPNTVVMTQTTARRLFGNTNPVGNVIRLDNWADLRVTGIAVDVEPNSHFHFDFLGSITTLDASRATSWTNNYLYTYLRLREGASKTAVEAKLPDLERKYVEPEFQAVTGKSIDEMIASGLRWGYFLQPMKEIHLYSDVGNDLEPQSDIAYVYIMSAVALFILLIAGINFVNLSTARSSMRAREVGVRKVLGSTRRELIRQFMSESVLLSLFALLLAFPMILFLLPAFNNITGKELSLSVPVLLILLGTALAVGVGAGTYPALLLSAFRPVAILKGGLATGSRGSKLRWVLVVTQFAISITLLIGTGVVFDQLRFMQNKRLGFDESQVIVLNLETDEGRQTFESFRNTLLQNPDVIQVAATTAVPGRYYSDTGFRPEGSPKEKIYNFKLARVSYEYFETLGIDLLNGRSFSRDFPTDPYLAYIVNETAVREMGLTPETAIGKQFAEIGKGQNGGDRIGQIIGVVKDYHVNSLHERIRGVAINIVPEAFSQIIVRIRPERIGATLTFIKEKYTGYEPGFPFEYRFLDEDFGRLYMQERRLGRIYGYFAAFAIFVACLGLFGLASFVTAQRTKEIGVRKVLGASVPQIVTLLSKEFTLLVLTAAVVAYPIAYFFMSRWLEDFAYRTHVNWYVFVLAGLSALLVAWLTVGYQSIKAATADPVESLRHE